LTIVVFIVSGSGLEYLTVIGGQQTNGRW